MHKGIIIIHQYQFEAKLAVLSVRPLLFRQIIPHPAVNCTMVVAAQVGVARITLRSWNSYDFTLPSSHEA
jgi:hypothetical protein